MVVVENVMSQSETPSLPHGDDDDHDDDDDDLVLVENWELSRIVNVVPKQFKC